MSNPAQYVADRKAQVVALGAMQGLCTLIMTADNGDGLPEKINATTFSELGMKPEYRQRILDCFDGKRLLSYKRLPDGGYEFLARANDTSKTLVRGSNGSVALIGSTNAVR